jgi:hypothetical protein
MLLNNDKDQLFTNFGLLSLKMHMHIFYVVLTTVCRFENCKRSGIHKTGTLLKKQFYQNITRFAFRTNGPKNDTFITSKNTNKKSLYYTTKTFLLNVVML